MYRLLIVEDEELIRKSLCVLIDWEEVGFSVAGAVENGGQALAFIAQNPVDVVMTDIRMPVMDGLELACELQSRYPRVKTILCSAYSEFAYARKGIEYGVYGYLLKSQDDEEIEEYFRQLRQKLDRESAHRLPDGKGGRPDFWEHREALAHLLQEGADPAQLREEAARCRVALEGFPMAALWFHLDNAALLREELDGAGMRRLEKLLEEQLLSAMEWQGQGFLLKTQDGPLVLWKDFAEGWRERLEALRLALCQELCAMQATAKAGLTAVMGLPAGAIEALPGSFASLKDALRCQLYLGEGRMILAQEEPFEERELSAEDSGRRLQQAQRLCHERDAAALCRLLEETCREWKARRITSRQPVELFATRFALLLADAAGRQGGMAGSSELLRTLSGLDTLEGIFSRLQLAVQELLPRPGEEAPQEKQPKKLVEKALAFMRENYAGDISLERTAAYVNVHPVHLSRLFRQETSQTFKGILTQLRIDAAKQMLSDLDLRIYEISERVGYQKPRYFSELFKEVTGMTPLEYREKR